ncbi:hypothetical protein [Clostridium sp.]|uniref:hypothetical protein n=1 Tax=Clostridium sp. TaxID=1506 RepID=UPI0026297777|nr:hypothetical protein [uncultured Clostridium sp.]
MSVENYIKSNVGNAFEKVYVVPEIPEKKLNNAISAIAPSVNPEYVLAIADSTLFGSAKEGIVFTGDTMYMRYVLEEKQKYKFENIIKSEFELTTKQKSNGKVEEQKHIYIHLNDERKIELNSNMFGVNYEKLTDLINGIINEAGQTKSYENTSQMLPLASMDNGIKDAYIKTICNFAYSDDDMIDSKEYAEIISLIVRIDYNSENRLKIKSYLCDISESEETDNLIQYLNDNVPDGSLDVIKKSLIKDILYIYKIQNDINSWMENDFLTSLQVKFEIEDKQIKLIIAAIKTDEEILELRKNDSEIKKSMKDLAAKASAVGVPLAAIYFSGSVVGMSAAGITSGLATVGMGGVLGFSGMVTGVGVVVLLGVGTYKGIKKFAGIGDLENNKQREMMLQAIIKNSQKSLDYLIEDINEISKLLMEEIKHGLETSKKIEKLSAILSMMSKGAKVTSQKINYAESEAMISHLPNTLDMTRLDELTSEATKEKLRGYILSCYIEKEANNEDEERKSTEFILNDKLPLNQLEQLYSVFEAIGYTNIKDAALASAKGVAKNLVKNIFGN